MSVKALTYVLENSQHKGNELLTLIVLADHADESGVCWPSIERLGKLIRADQRTAQRCIRRLVATGELKLTQGGGRSGTNRYQIHMQRSLELFPEGQEKGGNLPPGNLPGVTNEALKGDTAVSPEPSRTVIKKPSRQAAQPGPVALCLEQYRKGIKRALNADYPTSARANGQLAQLVKRVGAEAAPLVVAYYFHSSNPFYQRTGYKLDFLVRDCEQLYMAMSKPEGAGARAPEHARVELITDTDRTMQLQDYPVGEPLAIARLARREYGRLIDAKRGRSIAVQIGARRNVYRLEELAA